MEISEARLMVEDVVAALGFLCLGTRFKRIGERLQAETQRLLDELEVKVPSSRYPFLAALDRLGPLTIGELAQAIGISQPAVTRSLTQLVDLGLVEAGTSPEDQRRRVVALSAAGRRLVETGKRDVWPRLEAAVADLCAPLSGPLLEQLAAIEEGLADLPLDRRAARRREAAR